MFRFTSFIPYDRSPARKHPTPFPNWVRIEEDKEFHQEILRITHLTFEIVCETYHLVYGPRKSISPFWLHGVPMLNNFNWLEHIKPKYKGLLTSNIWNGVYRDRIYKKFLCNFQKKKRKLWRHSEIYVYYQRKLSVCLRGKFPWGMSTFLSSNSTSLRTLQEVSLGP